MVLIVLAVVKRSKIAKKDHLRRRQPFTLEVYPLSEILQQLAARLEDWARFRRSLVPEERGLLSRTAAGNRAYSRIHSRA